MTAPEAGHEWEVGVIWLTRRLRRPDRMLRDRFAAVRPSRALRREDGVDPGGRHLLDGCVDELALLALLVVVGFLVGPFLLVATALAVELALLLAVAALAPVARTILRQPWEVVARSPRTTLTWRIRGMRAARRLVEEIETAVRLGHDPAAVRPERRDHSPPCVIGLVPSLYRADAFRVLGRVLGVVAGIGAAVLVAVGWAAVT